MRYMFCGICLGLVSIATFGCGGSSEESGAVADSGGQAPAASPAAAMGGVAMEGAGAGSSAAPAGAPSSGMAPGAAAGGDPAAESGGAGSSAGQIAGGLSTGSPEGGDPTAAEGPAAGGTPGAGYPGTNGSRGAGYPGTSATPGSAGYPTGSNPAAAGTAGAGTAGAGYAGAMTGSGTSGSSEGMVGSGPGTQGTGQNPPNYGAGYGNSSRPPGTGGEAGTLTSPGGAGYPGGVPGAEGTPGSAAPQAPATYDEFAKQAFAQGREREAIQYLQAWAVTSDEGASEILSNIQWVNSLRRPVMAVRWGLGVQLTAPRGFSGETKPIGAQQAFPAARGSRSEGNPRAGGSGAGGLGSAGVGSDGLGSTGLGSGGLGGGGAAANGAVAQYAGEFGTAILDKFQSRVSSGKFGKVLKDAPTSGAGASAGSGYGAAGFGDADGAGAVGLSGGPAGTPGAAMRSGMRGGEGAGAAGGAGSESQISPGLTLIGVGTEKELKSKAREAGVDVLAIFRVKVIVTRGGFIDNDCELVLVDPAKEKADLFKTVALNNIKVQKDREQNKDDGVQKAVDKLFEFIDKDLTLTAMPGGLTPEAVKNTRIGKQLLAGPIDDPLAALTELRFYHRNKLLTDADAIAAITKVVGDEAAAKTLLEGKEEDRKKVIEKWLPKG